MNYLISGYPRTRTAWLCALMNAHGSLCYHEPKLLGIDTNRDVGIADPGIACFAPRRGVAATIGKPRICIQREDAREALEKWSGLRIDADAWRKDVWSNCQWFSEQPGTTTVAMDDLDDDDVVKEIVKLCTGRPASKEVIQIFQLLKIEQHLEKAQRIMPVPGVKYGSAKLRGG